MHSTTLVAGCCFPQVIPYLTVYAVFPSSLIFLLLFSLASQRMSRAALFNAIITVSTPASHTS
jgi:ATP/ADP translocase